MLHKIMLIVQKYLIFAPFLYIKNDETILFISIMLFGLVCCR